MHVLGHRTQTHLIEDYEENYFRVLKESGYHVEFIGKVTENRSVRFCSGSHE